MIPVYFTPGSTPDRATLQADREDWLVLLPALQAIDRRAATVIRRALEVSPEAVVRVPFSGDQAQVVARIARQQPARSVP